ncbi:methyl-accepting chemotaxis sensory transducer with TarH sensor [Aneurinibacillus soli]|uniref:Methyl-accepting chemotaxis protein McpA n=1 Tax=Aneurinibacillus soli TaxID=1500254 RepID=A0A0U4WJI4_9BACL|nr:methyl-accepting chemotaxis protein [Aneurinibacillus soli]PYE62097.1 methyl-accepting chemotaxis sensory transducer with TarH sensor [Aneurinibacillus soli]BAU28715.1 Methyl-accepting chemotaxis protein McpA [Aneurinibacillus soli]
MFNWMTTSVGRKLQVAFILLLLIPSLIIGTFSYHAAKNRIEADMMMSSMENVQSLNELITEEIEGQMKNVDDLSRSIDARMYTGRTSPIIMDVIHRFQSVHPEITSAYVGTVTGFLIADGADKLAPDYDPRKRDWYQNAIASKGEVVISEPYLDKISNTVVVGITKTLQDGSGVIGVDVNLTDLSNTVKHKRIGEHGYAFVVDRTKKVVVHPALKSGENIAESIASGLFEKESGEITYSDQGEARKLFFVTNKRTGWKIAGTMQMAEVQEGVQGIFWTTILTIFVSLLIGAMVMYVVIRSITRPLTQLRNAADKISKGDVTEEIFIHSKDEIGQLGEHFDEMRKVLQAVLHEVKEKVDHLAASSEELMVGSQETTRATEHISTTVLDIAGSSEEETKNVEKVSRIIAGMLQALQEIAKHTQGTSSAMVQTSDVAQEGKETIRVTVQQMGLINHSVQELSDIIKHLHTSVEEVGNFAKLITDISSQTNLLALNAAIEAARAGEDGRGFAVVADEVRKLAEQSSSSAEKVTDLIRDIKSKMDIALHSMDVSRGEVEKGLNVVGSAGSSFAQIYEAVDHVTQEIQQVAASVQEITTHTEQVVTSIRSVTRTVEKTSASITEVSASTEEQLASMQEVSATAASLTNMAEELERIVRKFNV